MVLVLLIALRLRAARQLWLAMQEAGQILALVEEIYAGVALAWTSDSASMRGLGPTLVIDSQPPQPEIEFSLTEHIGLEA